MKVYISGPISNIKDLNKPAFDYAESIITSEGNDPVNPHKIYPGTDTPTWSDYMRSDIAALIECDAVVALPGWELSRGARIEVGLAIDLGIPIKRLDKEGP